MKHLDCRHYLAVDVFGGLCKRTREVINADEAGCDRAEYAPRCRHCQHYAEIALHLGKCKGEAATYPDLSAITCKQFVWNERQ